jgi:two-component system, cell cycle sensor histidine kinase and response regulator CckA
MSVVISEPATGFGSRSPFPTWLGAWETSADSAYCRDLNGRILLANQSFARKFGWSTTPLPETWVADFVHSDDIAAMEATTAELNRPPYRMTIEHRWLTPQGVRWFAWEESVLRDEAGTIVAIRAVGRDITRQRLAEEQFYRCPARSSNRPFQL